MLEYYDGCTGVSVYHANSVPGRRKLDGHWTGFQLEIGDERKSDNTEQKFGFTFPDSKNSR